MHHSQPASGTCGPSPLACSQPMVRPWQQRRVLGVGCLVESCQQSSGEEGAKAGRNTVSPLPAQVGTQTRTQARNPLGEGG